MATITGTPNGERLDGGAEQDFIDGLGGSDTLTGFEGNDWLNGGDGDDVLDGGEGSDRLDAGAGRDTVIGGEGNDVLTVSLAAGYANGGSGADFIILKPLGPGEAIAIGTVFRGEDGDDDVSLQRASALTANLTLDAGSGSDQLVIFAADPGDMTAPRLEIWLNGEPPAAGPVLRGFERLSLGVAVDVHGTDGDETINTSATSDIVAGGGGNDLITTDPVGYDIKGQPVFRGADDTLTGGGGNDTISDFVGSNYIRGDEGNDLLSGGIGFDDLNGNMGDDTVRGGDSGDWVVGGKDQDVLFGENADDIVYGNLGNDTVDGGFGADTVRGGQGDDIVTGGAGADFLAGDLGADTVTGGTGADVFHTHAAAGLDRVTDFNAADGDRVNLLPGTTYTLSQQGADTLIDMGGGNQTVLVGVTLSSLPNGWIFGAT